MRIGIFDPYLDDLGGGEKYMLSLAEYLSKEHDVYVFWNVKEDFAKISERFSIDLSKIRLADNIFASKISLLKRLIETKKFDVIIVLSDGSIPLSLSKKLFIHIQQPIKMGLKNIKDKFKISRVNKVFCNSFYSKSYIDKCFGVNSLVIYPPVEIKAKNVKKQNVILHVGRFRPKDVISGAEDYKKQGIMTEIFKEMVKSGLKNWKFILAVSIRKGEEALFEALKKKTENLPIEFLVNETNDKLWDIYSIAKIYWHASGYGEDLIKHPEYAEHFGISTVEAMGSGAVPVAINCGGQKEIIENGKNGFLWNDLEELKDKTNNLINNPKLLEQFSVEAVKRASIYNRQNFCSKIHELIK